MHPKILFKFILDVMMFILGFILMLGTLLPIFLHESLGIIFIFCLVTHILLNRRLFITMTQRIFAPTTTRRNRLKALNNFMLMLSLGVIIYSAWHITRFIGSNVLTLHYIKLSKLHHGATIFGAVMLVLHLILHWNWLRTMFKKCIVNIKHTKEEKEGQPSS